MKKIRNGDLALPGGVFVFYIRGIHRGTGLKNAETMLPAYKAAVRKYCGDPEEKARFAEVWEWSFVR